MIYFFRVHQNSEYCFLYRGQHTSSTMSKHCSLECWLENTGKEPRRAPSLAPTATLYLVLQRGKRSWGQRLHRVLTTSELEGNSAVSAGSEWCIKEES